jgi:hypothetical protein
MTRRAVSTVLILTLVVGVAAWSKLRFVGQEGYHDAQRWRVQDYPAPMNRHSAGIPVRGSTAAGG